MSFEVFLACYLFAGLATALVAITGDRSYGHAPYAPPVEYTWTEIGLVVAFWPLWWLMKASEHITEWLP